MKTALQLIFQNYEGRRDDTDHVRDEVRLAELAEPLGFDAVWAVEHHFTDYAACPDNAQFLSYVAARTEKIKLGTAAFILPWNQPLRVAEKIVLLDHLSGGRAMLGMGRGLSRIEFDGFGYDMNESRARFDEASRMILDATDKGYIEGDGPYFPQPKTDIRPRPLRGFRDRMFAIGMSPDSVEQAARLGAQLTVFTQQSWETFAENSLDRYRTVFRQTHGNEPPPPVTADLLYCCEDAAEASAACAKHMAEYFLTVVQHYEIFTDKFKGLKGYESYASGSELLNAVGLEAACQAYVSLQSGGTPDQIAETLERRREIIGDFDHAVIAKYGSLRLEDAERSMRLYADKVLPRFR